MSIKNAVRASALVAAAAIPLPAAAHSIAGARLFVNTLIIDDPGVGDEAQLPLVGIQSPDGKSTITNGTAEYDKRLTGNLALGVGDSYSWITVDPNDAGKTHGGFGNPYLLAKYRWIVLPKQEFMSSIGLRESFGRAGTVGFQTGYDVTTVSAYAGKGLGDIPYAPIRPFAVTGELDYNIPNSGPAAGGAATSWTGGLTLQYSIPYLLAEIHHYDLPSVLARLTPLVELGWSSSAGASPRAAATPTTFLLGAGAIWTGERQAFAFELLFPLNGASGHGLGAIGQYHLYFDDLFPTTLGRPLLNWGAQ